MSEDLVVDSLASAAFVAGGSDLVNVGSLLYDKIINVKFIRKKPDASGKNFFCVRSDYEPVYHDDGSVEFVKCTQKPSITVSALQVANSVAVNVKIKVSSFFVDREMAGEELDSAAGNPIVWAVVQLGYFDEFPRWDKATSLDDPERFFDMDNNTLAGHQGVKMGKQLFVQILNCYPESGAPERSWVFNGVVATLETGLRWDHSPEDLVPGFGNDNFPGNKSRMEAMFYQWITRRFIRASVEHVVSHETVPVHDATTGEDINVDVVGISVYGYKKYMGLAQEDNTWTRIELDSDGLLKPADADKLGVLCTCSEALRRLASEAPPLLGTFATDADSAAAIAGIKAGFQQFDEAMQLLSYQVNAIRNHFQFLRWYTSTEGNLFFYMASETADDLFKDPAVKDIQRDGVLKLPAVYDITMSGTRVIRCPFRRVIDPLTTVLFQSRYRIIDSTGFYYQPARTHDAFLVLLSSFTFSTTDDDNMMELTCVDIPEEDAPEVDFATGLVIPRVGTTRSDQYYTTDPDGAMRKARLAWAEVSIKVGDYPYDRTSFGWLDLARGIMECARPDDWPSGMPSIDRALDDLKAWNAAGVWNAGREKSGDDYSPENELAQGYGSKIPWLYPGDTVVVRQPYKETYDDAYKQEGVKANG